MSALAKRRWPQLSLRTLLLASVVAMSLTAFWTMWPHLTIAEFRSRLQAGDLDAAVEMIQCEDGYNAAVYRGRTSPCICIVKGDKPPTESNAPFSYGTMTVETAEVVDLLCGRRHGFIHNHLYWGRFGGCWAVTIQAGTIFLNRDNLPERY
jgi:hypothetical protein